MGRQAYEFHASCESNKQAKLNVMMEYEDKDLGRPMSFEEWFKEQPKCDLFNEDTYNVLMDRVEGNETLRIKSCRPGPGV